MHINWEARSYFDFNSLDPFATHGIPLPTYGNYGGPNYSAGEVGGKITGTSADPPPVDPLDALFKTHDLVYQTTQDPLARATADVQLVENMYALTFTALATLTTTPRLVYMKDLPRWASSPNWRPGASYKISPFRTKS